MSYAEALDFATTFCMEQLLAGVDESPDGWPDTNLTDTTRDFIAYRINAGAPVYNVTTGVYGLVSAVAETVLQTTVVWADGDRYILMPMSANQRAEIEWALQAAAGPIDAARASAGAAQCTLSAGARQHLKLLNSVIAAVFHNCQCGSARLSENERLQYMNWANEQLRLIRTGEMELCEGHTGKDYLAAGVIERAWTPGTAAQIVLNRERRRA